MVWNRQTKPLRVYHCVPFVAPAVLLGVVGLWIAVIAHLKLGLTINSLLRFASPPGAEDTIVLPGTGQTARVRLVRAYAAASGRECREVLVGTGGGGTSRLLCRAGEGWREARPLITAGTGRP